MDPVLKDIYIVLVIKQDTWLILTKTSFNQEHQSPAPGNYGHIHVAIFHLFPKTREHHTPYFPDELQKVHPDTRLLAAAAGIFLEITEDEVYQAEPANFFYL